MKAFLRAAACAVLICCAPPAASAATITKTLSFTATDFSKTTDMIVIDNRVVTGSFTVTLDPAVTQSGLLNGITVNNLSIAVDSPVSFTYVTGGSLLIGGSLYGNNGISPNTNDFWLQVFNFNTDKPRFEGFTFTQTDMGGAVLRARTAFVSVVPEPSTWALLIAGFGATGGMLRAQRRRMALTATA